MANYKIGLNSESLSDFDTMPTGAVCSTGKRYDGDVMKPIAHYMEQAGVNVAQLVKATGLERDAVQAIVTGNYTPSPVLSRGDTPFRFNTCAATDPKPDVQRSRSALRRRSNAHSFPPPGLEQGR